MATRPILTESQWDVRHGATITANDVAASTIGNGWAASNLGLNGTKDRWKTTNVTGTKTVTYQLVTAKSVSFSEIYRHNGTAAGTIRWRYFNGVTTVGDSGAISLHQVARMSQFRWRSCCYVLPAPVTADKITIDISDATNPDGAFIAGRVIHGLGLQTELYPIAGSSFLAGVDYSAIDQGPLGFDSAVVQEPRMDFRQQWVAKALDEVERLNEIFLLCGSTQDIAAVRNPTATTLGYLNLGVFRFRPNAELKWNAQISETQGHVSATLDLKAVI